MGQLCGFVLPVRFWHERRASARASGVDTNHGAMILSLHDAGSRPGDGAAQPVGFDLLSHTGTGRHGGGLAPAAAAGGFWKYGGGKENRISLVCGVSQSRAALVVTESRAFVERIITSDDAYGFLVLW